MGIHIKSPWNARVEDDQRDAASHASDDGSTCTRMRSATLSVSKADDLKGPMMAHQLPIRARNMTPVAAPSEDPASATQIVDGEPRNAQGFNPWTTLAPKGLLRSRSLENRFSATQDRS